MTKRISSQQSKPLHIENTVLQMGKEDLNINNAFQTYRDMKLDGIVSGSMSFIKAVLVKDFKLKAPAKATEQELRVCSALNDSLEDMPYDKRRLVNGWLQMLDYGCSLHEVVLKRDNGISVFQNISPIHLSTVNKFKFKQGVLEQLQVGAVDNDGLVETVGNVEAKLSGDKVLFFRLEPDSDFPLGKSLLYGAYTSWKTKKILQEYEAIGVAKNLSGVLDIAAPSDYINKYYSEPASDEAIYIDNLLLQAEMLHAGKGSYVLRASDTNQNGVKLFEITTIGGGGSAQTYDVGKAIGRYNQEIQLSLQTMVLSLGADGGGSFALSDNSTHLMTLFIENIRNVISSEFRKAIKMVWAANGLDVKRLPKMEWEDIEPVDWDDFTKGWQRLIQSGGVTTTKELESFLRAAGDAPEAVYEDTIYNNSTVDESERLDSGKVG